MKLFLLAAVLFACLIPFATASAGTSLIDPWPASVAWYYNPAGAPAGFDEGTVIAAARSWGLQLVYAGHTTQVASCTVAPTENVVGWGSDMGPNAGLTCFDAAPQARHFNIVINPAAPYLQGAFAHEFGHALGLPHPNCNPRPGVQIAMLMCVNGSWLVEPTLADRNALSALYPLSPMRIAMLARD